MFKLKLFIILLIVGCFFPLSGFAADFDGSKPMFCAVTDVYECTVENACQHLAPKDLLIPRFLNIDVKKKIISGQLEDGTPRTVDILEIAHDSGNLILQGHQKGRAWSVVIREETGKATFSISEKEMSVVCFGESIIP